MIARIDLVTNELPITTQKKIKRWAKKNNFRILIYRGGYIKLKIGRGYSRAMIIIYIFTFWMGAILHRIVRSEYGKLNILLYPYGPGTFLILEWKGGESALAAKNLKKELKAKTFRPSQFYF